jgi:DNA-binding NarL/FixJ family response regulator
MRAKGHTATVIGVTGNCMPADIAHFIAKGVNDVLPKPVTVDGLVRMLRRHGWALPSAATSAASSARSPNLSQPHLPTPSQHGAVCDSTLDGGAAMYARPSAASGLSSAAP